MSSSVLTPPTRSESPLYASSAAPDLVAPAYVNIPDEYDPERTLGRHVGALATLAGFPPDPEQQLLLDVSFALDKRGRPLIFKNIVIAPRQNLKTGFAKQRVLGKQFILQRPLVVWSAHEFDTARRALIDLEALIEGCPDLRRKVALTSRRKIATHGAVPEIKLLPKYGSATLAFKTRTAGGGRGLTGDDLTVDEAFAAQAAQMGAVLPIMLARPLSQVDFLSSACRPESAYLWELVQLGRSGSNDGRTFYIEWCLPPPSQVCDLAEKCKHVYGTPGCGLDKPEVLRLGHPAITRERITLQKIADLRAAMPGEDGGREAGRELGGWHDEPDEVLRVISEPAWTARQGADGRPSGAVAFAMSASWPDADMGSIVVAGRNGAEVFVQVIEHRPGTAWMPARMKELQDEWKPVDTVLDEADPAAKALGVGGEQNALLEAGVQFTLMTTKQVTSAFGLFVAGVRGDVPYVRHYDQPELNDAVASAGRRSVGDAHTWDRKGPDDVSPVVAATDALYALTTRKPLAPFVLVGK